MMQENLSRYPLVLVFISFSLGIWFQTISHFPSRPLLLLFLLSNILVLLCQRSIIFPLILAGLFFMNGQWSIIFWQKSRLDHHIVSYFPVENIDVKATLIDPPQNNRRMAVVRVEKIYNEIDTIELDKKFICRFPDTFPEMVPGNLLFFHQITLAHLPKRRNPGQFDFSANYRRLGIMGEIIVQEKSEIQLFALTDRFSFRRMFYIIRQSINRRLSYVVEKSVAGFLSAILLGYRQEIPSEVKLDFQKGGVAHVIAISGLHVGFIVIIFSTLLSFFPLSFRCQHLLTIFLLMIYMLLSGAQPPVIRATLMVTIYLLGMMLQRKPDILNTLFLAGFLFILYQPQDLFSISFQFSFIAVLSIILFYKRFEKIEKWVLENIPAKRFCRKIILRIVQLFLISLAAQIGTIPLTIFYFKQWPVVALILNLPVIPLIGIIIPIGFMMVSFAWINGDIAFSIGQFLTLLIKILFQIVHLSAHLPGSCLRVPSFDWMALLIYAGIMWLGFSFLSSRLSPFRKPVVVLLLFFVLWKLAPSVQCSRLLMLDVGQGESTLLITPTAKNVLFDTGPTGINWDSGSDIIYPALQELGIMRLNKVILSHPHSDHIGGIFSLIKSVSIDSIYLPDVKSDYFWQDSLLKAIRKHKIPHRFVQLGDDIPVDPFTKIYFLGPRIEQLQPLDQSGKSINNTSLVALVKMDGTSLIFTGDTESDMEKYLLQWSDFLKADIIKVGHHGSKTSSSLEFLQKIQPQIALIPVGQKNKFDHPSEITLKRLNDLHIPYYRTDVQGAIFLQWEQTQWRLVDWD